MSPRIPITYNRTKLEGVTSCYAHRISPSHSLWFVTLSHRHSSTLMYLTLFIYILGPCPLITASGPDTRTINLALESAVQTSSSLCTFLSLYYLHTINIFIPTFIHLSSFPLPLSPAFVAATVAVGFISPPYNSVSIGTMISIPF